MELQRACHNQLLSGKKRYLNSGNKENRNGKQVTVTKTTIRNPDGTTHTEVQESVADGGRTISQNKYSEVGSITNGQRKSVL